MSEQKTNVDDLISELGLQVPAAVLPSSMSVQSLEQYMEHAARYRLNFTTTSIDDFIAYNTTYDAAGATCFVSAPEMTAETIFDLGTTIQPGHKAHRAELSLQPTAAYQALQVIDGNKLGQKQAAEFLEDWADFVTVQISTGEPIPVKAAAKSLMDLTIEAAKEVNSKVSDFGAQASSMERIEAKFQEQIPAYIEFKCHPYNGLTERSFWLRVSILTGDDRPKIVFRIVQLEPLKEKIAEEFKAKLDEAFKKLKLKTFIGEVR